MRRTSSSALAISCSCPDTSRMRILPDSSTSGITDAVMSTAMKSEAIGSKPVQPKYLSRIVEMMTPTEPICGPRACQLDGSAAGHSTHSVGHDVQVDAHHVVRVSVPMAVVVAMPVLQWKETVSQSALMRKHQDTHAVVMAMVVAVRVAVPVVVVSAHGKHAEEVDAEAHARDDEQLRRVVHLGRRDDALHGLKDDEHRDQDQEHAVGKAAERLDAVVAVREGAVRRPARHDGGKEAHADGGAVEEHVDRVGDQTQAVRPHAPEQLHAHEDEVEAEELEDLARVVRLPDRGNRALARRHEGTYCAAYLVQARRVRRVALV